MLKWQSNNNIRLVRRRIDITSAGAKLFVLWSVSSKIPRACDCDLHGVPESSMQTLWTLDDWYKKDYTAPFHKLVFKQVNQNIQLWIREDALLLINRKRHMGCQGNFWSNFWFSGLVRPLTCCVCSDSHNLHTLQVNVWRHTAHLFTSKLQRQRSAPIRLQLLPKLLVN